MKLVGSKVEEHCSSTVSYFILLLSVGGQKFTEVFINFWLR